VAVYEPATARVVAMLAGHGGRVNAVAWVNKLGAPPHDSGAFFADEEELVSAGAEGAVRVWRLEHAVRADEGAARYTCTGVLAAGAAPVTAVAVTTLLSHDTLVAATGGDCTVRVWHRASGADAWTALPPATLRAAAVAEAVAITPLPGGEPGTALLAAGGVDRRIHLYAVSAAGGLTPLLQLAGHLDWIRCLSFSHHASLAAGLPSSALLDDTTAPTVYLASAAQDGKVRLWKVARRALPAAAAAAAAAVPVGDADDDAGSGGDDDDDDDDDDGGRGKGSLRANAAADEELLAVDDPVRAALHRPRCFSPPGSAAAWEVSFDALLAGHDAWVNTVQWHAPVVVAGTRLWQPPLIITASMDKSVNLWQPTGASAGGGSGGSAAARWGGTWEVAVRVGSAGGAVAGLYGAQLSPCGTLLLAHGFQGAVHTWVCAPLRSSGGGGGDSGLRAVASVAEVDATAGDAREWTPVASVLGHYGAVTDATWAPDGSYLVTTSVDHTTRVWAPAGVGGAVVGGAGSHWAEVSRPQMHGYEMTAAVVPALPTLRHRLLSAGDEKVIRVFDAPRLFFRAVDAVTGPSNAAEHYGAAMNATDDWVERAEFSYVPEMSLTNKAVTAEGAGAPITDRLQADGRDAVQRVADTKAAALKSATASVLASSGAGGGEGEEEGGGGGGGEAEASGGGGAAAAAAVAAAAAALAGAGASAAAIGGAVVSCAARPPGDDGAAGAPPPLEEDLVQHSRWPETNKLFGHVHEVMCLAVNGAGTVLASASKARTEDGAAIRLWDVLSGGLLQVLPVHKLTVLDLAWSPPPAACARYGGDVGVWGACAEVPAAARGTPAGESEFLVSVSKDRSLAIFGATAAAAAPTDAAVRYPGLTPDGAAAAAAAARPPTYALLAHVPRAHKRLIWAAAWCPLPCASPLLAAPAARPRDDDCAAALFATASRDGTVRLWCLAHQPAATAPPPPPPPAPAGAAAAAARRRRGGGEDDDEDGGAGGGGGGGLALGDGTVLGTSEEAGDGGAGTHRLALVAAAALPPLESAATAVDWAPLCTAGGSDGSCTAAGVLAVGCESGRIAVFHVAGHRASGSGAWTWTASQMYTIAPAACPFGAVSRLAWRPLPPAAARGAAPPATLLLAAGAADESVRLYRHRRS